MFRNTLSASQDKRQDIFKIDKEKRRLTDDKAHLCLTASKQILELSTKNAQKDSVPSQASKSVNTHLEGGDAKSDSKRSIDIHDQSKSDRINSTANGHDTFILHQGLINSTIQEKVDEESSSGSEYDESETSEEGADNVFNHD